MRINCGMFYNRRRFVNTMIMIPIFIIFYTADVLLVYIGQDPKVAKIASIYVTILMPGVWAMGQFDSSKKFLSAQYMNAIPVYTQIITVLLHLVWCYLFIEKF